MKFTAAADDFLAQKRIAVVGVSRRPDHVTRMIFNKLRTAERDVIPVNPTTSEIEGVHCYPDLASIPGGVTAVLVVTRPAEVATVVRECIALGITRVWLHRAFGRGSVSAEAVRLAREAKVTLIPAGCPMMFCEPVDLPHKCLRWCLQFTGKLPKDLAA